MSIHLYRFLALCFFIFAQYACGDNQIRGPRMSPKETAEILKAELDLTNEQKGEIKKILEESQTKIEKLRNSYSGERMEMRSKIREIRIETKNRIKKLLNEEQKIKYDQYQKKQRQDMRDRRQRND